MTCSSGPLRCARSCSAMALATSLSTEKMSVNLRSNISAQRWESLGALISCTFTRTASPLFCTLPCCGSNTRSLHFFGHGRIPEFFRVEIHDRKPNAVFHLSFAEVMEVRAPVRIMLEILGDAFGNQNMPRITAIHHSLRHVNPGASDVRSAV